MISHFILEFDLGKFVKTYQKVWESGGIWPSRKILSSPCAMDTLRQQLHLLLLTLKMTQKRAERIFPSEGREDHIRKRKRGKDKIRNQNPAGLSTNGRDSPSTEE